MLQTQRDLYILSEIVVSAEEKHLLKLLLSLLLPVYKAGFGYTDVSGGIADVASARASGTGENRRT